MVLEHLFVGKSCAIAGAPACHVSRCSRVRSTTVATTLCWRLTASCVTSSSSPRMSARPQRWWASTSSWPPSRVAVLSGCTSSRNPSPSTIFSGLVRSPVNRLAAWRGTKQVSTRRRTPRASKRSEHQALVQSGVHPAIVIPSAVEGSVGHRPLTLPCTRRVAHFPSHNAYIY